MNDLAVLEEQPTRPKERCSSLRRGAGSLCTAGSIKVQSAPLPLTQVVREYSLPAGLTVTEVVNLLVPRSQDPLSIRVYIGPDHIPERLWSRIKIKDGQLLRINSTPLGGGGGKKNPLAAVLALVVAVTAAFLGPLAAGSLGFVEGTLAFKAASALISAGISAIGGLLVNAIAPPPSPSLSGANNRAESATLFIQGARNDARLYDRIPVPLGRHRMVPPLGALNYTESIDDAQYVRQLFCYGYGKVNIYERRIGETLLTEFDDVETDAILDGTSESSPLELYPNAVYQEQLSVQLTNAAGYQTRTTQPNADEIIVDIQFPRGLARYDAEGNRKGYTVDVEIQYAVTGTGSWSTAHVESFNHATTSAILRSIRFAGLANNTYDVRVRRTTGDSTSDKILDESWWAALKTVTYENPVAYEGLSLEALRIRASEQLSGAVDQYNAIYFALMPDWDSGSETWIERETNNCASIYRYLLQNSSEFGNVGPNPVPLADERIDLAALQDWHDYCVAKGLKYNSVIDYEASLWDLLHEVAAAGHATPTIVDNKWSVIIEREQSVYAQHFTPVNSWGYKGERTFTGPPHAFRCLFLNERKGFIQDELVVYADGYTKVNATNIQELRLPGVTDPDLVYRHARRYIAILELRKVIHSFYVSVEHLKCPRGSLVKFAHDVPLIGLANGYIIGVTLDSGNVTHIRLDQNVEIEGGKSYALTFRAHNNTLLTKTVVTLPGETNQLQVTTPFPVTDLTLSTDPEQEIEEDITFSFGIAGRVTIDGIVKAVIPQDDLTAQVILVESHPAIFNADTEVIPPYESLITLPVEMSRPSAPIIMNIQTGAEVQVINIDGSISTRMVINLKNRNAGEVVPVIKIRSSGESSYVYPTVLYSSPTKIVLEGFDPGTWYDVQIFYKRVLSSEVSGILNNQWSVPAVDSVLFQGVEGIPADVTGLRLQVIGTMAVLQWDRHEAIDLDHYEIRFTPNTVDPTWASAAVYQEFWYSEFLTIPLQLGTYLVKAYDKQGQPSANAASVSTDLSAISGYNAIEVVAEHPTFAGTKTNVVIDGGTGNLELDDLSLGTGLYEYATDVDLGQVYTAVITPRVIVAGRSTGSTMDTWPTLDLLGYLSGATDGSWNVKHEIRLTNDDPGGSPVWGPWQEVHVGEYTFRALQSRITLNGNGSTITPTIKELGLSIDMPDRIVTGDSITDDTGPITVSYTPAFHTAPSLVIRLKDGVVGDEVLITNETREGFDIEIINSAANVERNFTFHAVGYGSEQ